MSTHNWSVEDSLHYYQVPRWSDGHFNITEHGHLCALPEAHTFNSPIVINEVLEEMQKEGIKLPAVIRFHDILRSQVKKINQTFRSTIKKANFKL